MTERDEHGFSDHGLDHLHQRVASGSPQPVTQKLAAVLKGLEEHQGQLVITAKEGEWLVAVTFGQEAPDSDMAGGASYGRGETLSDALRQVLVETGWGG